MEDDSSGGRNHETLARHRRLNTNGKRSYDRPEKGSKGGDGDTMTEEEEECDVEVWGSLSKSFNQVQSLLDQNHALIRQVNENQQSKIPDNLAKNVALIREINRNISTVVSLYSDLSVDFSSVVHRRRTTPKISGRKDGEVPGALLNEN